MWCHLIYSSLSENSLDVHWLFILRKTSSTLLIRWWSINVSCCLVKMVWFTVSGRKHWLSLTWIALSANSNRINRACELCRRRKVKCDGDQPCSACIERNISSCIYRQYDRRPSRKRFPLTSSAPTYRTGVNTTSSSSHGPISDASALTPQLQHDPEMVKMQREFRAGIGGSNTKTGSFQFYGNKLAINRSLWDVLLTYQNFRALVSYMLYPEAISTAEVAHTWNATWSTERPCSGWTGEMGHTSFLICLRRRILPIFGSSQ